MGRGAIPVDEIAPEVFESELRNGDDVVVLDTRDRGSFGEWHVDGAVVRNVPEEELSQDPGLLADIPADARVRVVCYAGIGSRRVAASLAGRFAEVRSVTGGMIGWSRLLRADEVPVPGPVRIIQFRREARGCLSYLLVADREALVVDPAPDVAPYLDAAEAEGARITRVLDTHVHADHLSGARDLAAATGAVLHLPRAALRRGVRFAQDVSPVADGALLALGEQGVRIVALPGHTSDMTGVLVDEAALLAGDSLFLDAVARPDLEDADPEAARQAARRLHSTLTGVIGRLPGTTLLLPAHYPGGRRDGPLTATLGEVRANVPDLGLDTEAFVGRTLERLPRTPANHLAIIAVNLGDDLPGDQAARLEVGANSCAAAPTWAAPQTTST